MDMVRAYGITLGNGNGNGNGVCVIREKFSFSARFNWAQCLHALNGVNADDDDVVVCVHEESLLRMEMYEIPAASTSCAISGMK